MDKSRTSGEWERMVSGQLYTPVDPEIAKRHRVGMRRCDRFNRLPLWCAKTKQRALERLIPSAKGKNFEAFAPFYCEYGVNIYVGRNCFVNYNSVFLDVAPITLGDNVLIGPNVTLATPNHPFIAEERAYTDYPNGCHALEYAEPITIGDHCWLCAGATVCGGVTDAEVDEKQVTKLVRGQKGRVQDCAVVFIGVCESCCAAQKAASEA